MKSQVNKWLHSHYQINTVFFVFSFLYLLGLSSALAYASNFGFALSSYVFFYSAIQSFLEVLCFCMIGFWIKQFLPRWLYTIYTGIFFLCLLAHLINYILIRLIDTNISYARDLFFSEDLLHFITTVRSLDMPPTFLAFMAITIFLVPWAGAMIYRGALKFSKKRELTLSFAKCSTVFVLGVGVVLTLDLFVHPKMLYKDYITFEKMLPLSNTIYRPKGPTLNLENPVKRLPPENQMMAGLATLHFKQEKRPNIYLFVIETFRADHITKQIAPNLHLFKQNHLSFNRATSNGNSSHLSWYSIFHSNFAHHWKNTKETWKRGALPLHILKKMGYKTHVIASTDIKYFHMKELLFGENEEAIDEFIDLAEHLELSPDQRDLKAISTLQKAIDDPSLLTNQLYIVFLDATHSNYNWPDDFSSFTPYVDELNYFELISFKNSLEQVRNRYKNAVNYIDHLFSTFQKTLQKKEAYNDSIIVVTGDHAEEFFEDGAIFHGTHFNEYQTHIPLFYKFPIRNGYKKPHLKLGTQVDIFPSIIHYLSNNEYKDLYEGESIFTERKWPFTVTAMHNGNNTPYELWIQGKGHQVHLQSSQANDFHTDNFTVISFKNQKEEPVHVSNKNIQKALETKFSEAFEKLTRGKN